MTATKPLYIENITNKANTEPTHRLRFSNRRNAIKDTINDMIKIIQEDMLLPYTRNKATSIIRDAGLVDGRDKYQVALAIYRYLQDIVTYVEDPQDLEYMQRTYRLLEETKAGDCDDFSIAGASLLLSLNVPVKIRVVGTESPDYFNHVYLLINIDGKLIPFDPIYKSRRMGQEPEIIYRKQDFEIAPINELFGKDYSLAVILNGDTRMKGNKLGLYNKLYTTLAGDCLNRLTRTLGADTQDDEYKRAYEFFMFYSYPRIDENSVIPEEIKEIVEKDEEIQQAYKENRLTLDTLRGNQDLLGYMLAGMIDHYTLSGNFWQNLWSGIKKVGNVIWQGAKAILPAVLPGVGTAISQGMNFVENLIKPKTTTTTTTTPITTTQTVKPATTQTATTIQTGKTTTTLPNVALTQQQVNPYASQNFLQQPLQSASNLLNNQYISALLNQIPGVNQVYSTFQNAIPFFQQITPYFQLQGDKLGFTSFINPLISSTQSNADTNNLRDIDNLINATLSSPLSLPLAHDKRKSLLTAIISKANQYIAIKSELDELYNMMYNYFPAQTKPQQVSGLGQDPTLSRVAISKKQDLEYRVKTILTELYIKIYLLWNMLTPEQQKAVVQKLQKYEVYSAVPGNAPYNFDNERFFRLEMQDLQEQVEAERLEYYAVVNLLKELVETITKQQETLNTLKNNERQDIVDLISFYNSQVSGLGQFSNLAARLDYRKDITENVRALEQAIKTQKGQLEKLVELQNDATIKLLVKTLLELQVRIIREKAKNDQNQALIDAYVTQLNQKSLELKEALEQIGTLSEEATEQLSSFQEQTQQYQEKLEELSNTYKEDLDRIVTEKNDTILTNQENYLTERNNLITNYESQLTEKEKDLDYIRTMHDAAKSMIDLLPEKARQIINSFSEQDFISPSPARIKEIYKMYAQLRFELKEQFDEMKDEVIKRLKEKQFRSQMALAQVRADLDLIKDMMMQNPIPEAKPYVDEFEKQYKALAHELEQTKEDADLMYFNALDSGIMTIADGVKKLQVYVIASIKNMNPELPTIGDTQEEELIEEEIEEE